MDGNGAWHPARRLGDQKTASGLPEPVPERQEDHGRIPVPVLVRFGGLDQGVGGWTSGSAPGIDRNWAEGARGQAPQPQSGAPKAQGLRARLNP